MEQELIHENLSKAIIGAAMTALNPLRPGLDEQLQEHETRLEASRSLNSSSVPSV